MQDDHAYFTEAHCYALALEIYARTAWPLYALVEHGGGVHALVKLPDGRYLDICGPREAGQVRADWRGAVLRRVSERYFDGWDEHFDPVDRRRVRRAADRLLRPLRDQMPLWDAA